MNEFSAVAGSDNVFRDLGFPGAEAQNMLLRTDLAIHIRKVIEKSASPNVRLQSALVSPNRQ